MPGSREERKMATTTSFKDLVQTRVARDTVFAAALLREGIDAIRGGEIKTGLAVLSDYITAVAPRELPVALHLGDAGARK
jgi:hypothetical protein